MELRYVQHLIRYNLENQDASWHVFLLGLSELTPSLHCKQDVSKVDEPLRLQWCKLDRHLVKESLRKVIFESETSHELCAILEQWEALRHL